jgi:hypothetical protein
MQVKERDSPFPGMVNILETSIHVESCRLFRENRGRRGAKGVGARGVEK